MGYDDNRQEQAAPRPNLVPVPDQECDWAQRDFGAYRAGLFPDDGYQPQTLQELAAAGFQYFGRNPDDEGAHATFQGLEGFFHPGAAVLDIGSGSGRAVDDMIDVFGAHGVTVTGLDMAYLTAQPVGRHKDVFIGGSWDNMPFRNNHFTGLLSYESFPTHAWPDDSSNGHERNVRTIEEITRVAQHNAVWRATVGGFSGLKVEALISLLQSRGWEAYYFPGLLVARLVDKASS